MPLHIAVPCVHYDDFLSLTLARNLEHFPRITVLTSPSDRATIAVAERNGAEIFLSDHWFAGGPLNKAGVLNEWIDSLGTLSEDSWLLALDADIILAPGSPLRLDALDPRKLYGAQGWNCRDQQSWNEFVRKERSVHTFRPRAPRVIDGKVWGSVPTSNVAGLCGFFQMWNPAKAAGMKRFPPSANAAGYDVEFALSFGDLHRAFVPDFEVIHLGPAQVNWHGRVSPRWTESLPFT